MIKRNRVRIDAITQGVGINRYLTLWHTKKYDDSGERGQEKVISEKRGLNIEWENIKRDMRAVAKNPLKLPQVAPQFAYTLAGLVLYLGGFTLSGLAFVFTGAVAYDASTAVGGDTQAATSTLNHASSGSNRMAVLVAAKTYTATFSDAIHDSTGGADAMTEAGQTSVTDGSNVGIFYYANPSTSSVTYSCTSSAADFWGFVVYSFTGCSGTVDGFQEAEKVAFASQPASVTVTTTSGDMVVGGGADDAGRDLTGGTGQTDVDIPTTGGKTTTSYKAADDTSETFSYTWPTNGNATCAAVRVAVAAAGGGEGNFFPFLDRR